MRRSLLGAVRAARSPSKRMPAVAPGAAGLHRQPARWFAVAQQQHACGGGKAGEGQEVPGGVHAHAGAEGPSSNPCTPCETSCSVSLPKDMACWSCNRARPAARCADNLFCGSCGQVQPPAPKCNFFDLMGVTEEKFNLNLKELEMKYKALMGKLHPDRFMTKGEQPLEFSQAQTSVVNVAYTTLRCPFQRAEYMLRRMGVNFEEETSSADPEFMMEILEMCSRVEEAGRNQRELETVRDEFYLPNLTECEKEFAKAYSDGDARAAATVAARMMYLRRLKQQLHDVLNVQ